MHVVTGGAGFIGSNLVRALNDRGIRDIAVVDAVDQAAGRANLARTQFADYIGHDEFRRAINGAGAPWPVDVIYHLGASTDTTQNDEPYVLDINFEYSKDVLAFALANRVPLVYGSSAAVYGANTLTKVSPANEAPLNLYARSKLLFDNHVRRTVKDPASTVVGLRFFNVYGPGESRKGPMASMVYQLYRQISQSGVARLFEGTDGFADGDQRRDFIYVDDIVATNIFFAEGPVTTGIYNVGTGQERSFNDLAKAVINCLGKGEIEYIPFPESLRGRYQSFTKADLTDLVSAGFDAPFTSLEEGVRQYCAYLSEV